MDNKKLKIHAIYSLIYLMPSLVKIYLSFLLFDFNFFISTNKPYNCNIIKFELILIKDILVIF